VSWVATAKLGDLVEILSGFAFDSKRFGDSGDIPIARIRDVVTGRSSTFYRGEFEPQFVINDGDLLIGMDGEFNRARWQGGRALLNQRVCRIRPANGHLYEPYLFHFLPRALKAIEDVTPFATVKHLSTRSIRAIDMPLPQLSEQRRIAAILDKADALRAKRRAALTQLNTLTHSIFLDIFGDPATNPNNLPTTRLENLCTRITDGTHQPPAWSLTGNPFLFVANVTTGEIRFDTKKFISDETHARLTARCPIEVGDVLYSTVGSYGVPALVATTRKFAFQRHIAHLKPNRDLVVPEFLRAMLGSVPLKRQADQVARGVAQKTVNLADVRNFLVFCPSLATQRTFVAQVDLVRKIVAPQRAALDCLDALFASLQQRAFRGEL
jgi:type I restriction enzyme S subunit